MSAAVDAVVGHGADLRRAGTRPSARRAPAAREEGGPVALDPEQRRSSSRTRPGRGGPAPAGRSPPGETMPSSSARPSARRRALAWSSARRSIMPVGPVAQGDQAGRGQDADLAHAAADAACAPRRARQMKSRRADDDRADRAGEALRQAERHASRPGRRGRARRTPERDDGVEEARAVDVERDAAARGRSPPTVARVRRRVSGWPIEWAWVFSMRDQAGDRLVEVASGRGRRRAIAAGSIVPSGRSGIGADRSSRRPRRGRPPRP